MADVGYFAPTEMGEALKFLADYGDRATVLAGGTDLVPRINYYQLKPQNLMYLVRLGLDHIREEGGALVLGAGVTLTQLLESDLAAQKAPSLVKAAGLSGGVATRSVATIGGNLVNASPAADVGCVLLSLDAEFVLAKAGGSRTVAAADFYTGPGGTVLDPGELLQEVRIPLGDAKTAFQKLGKRKALTISVVNAAVCLKMDGGTCQEARVVLGAMAPILLRCTQAEAALKGQALDAALIQAGAEKALAQCAPIDDQRASAWYRRKAGLAVAARTIAEAASLSN